MRIKKLRLKNDYKRFKDLTINLGNEPAKIIALVGSNGCGKSSVFDGMMFLQNNHHVVGRHGAGETKSHSMKGIDYKHQDIEISFDRGNYSAIYEEKAPSGKGATIFNLRSPHRHNGHMKVTTLGVVSNINSNNVGASKTNDLDDKMLENYQRLYSKIDNELRLSDITLSQAKEKIFGELNKILKKCLELEITDVGNILDNRGCLYFKKNNQPNEFEFNVLSSGEKEVVDILLDLYLKKENYNDTIYLIDEPELHLNTGIQKNFLLEITKIIPETCQLWIATHSVGFLRAIKENLKDDCQIIYFNGDYSSTAKILEPMPKTRDNWQKIFEIALEDMVALMVPKEIICCEGRNAAGTDGLEKGFDARVYNKIFAETRSDALFVSGGGHGEIDKYHPFALSILKKVVSGFEFLVLKDKDINDGNINDESPTTDKQRLDWIAKDPNKHRMLKRKEVEDYLLDFQIFSKLFNKHKIGNPDKKYQDITEDEYKKLVASNPKKALGKIKEELFLIKSGMSSEDFGI